MATHRGTRGSHARRRRWAALLGVTALAVTAGGALAAPAGAAGPRALTRGPHHAPAPPPSRPRRPRAAAR
ncbi:hypothetical protein ACFV0X_08165, partial [Streptomyces mirabilis]